MRALLYKDLRNLRRYISQLLLICLAFGLLFGIGALFVDPYVKATEAELYAALRAKVLASGYVTEEELTGQS